jgi:integrase/recombinase XerD
MRERVVSILLRVKVRPGEKRFYPAIVNTNGTIKPFYCRIAGQEVYRRDGIYYLRYTNYYGNRVYKQGGTDPKLVRSMQLQRQHIIAGEVMGLPTIDPPPAPKPVKVAPTAPASVLPHAMAAAASAASDGTRLPLVATIDKFVHEKTIARGYGCGAHYQTMLSSFINATTKAYLDEIDDDEIIHYVGELRKRNLSPRTIENYCASLNTFLRRYQYKDRVKKQLVPRATEKIVRAYSLAQLKSIFAACSPLQRLLYQFFLGLGMREREVMFASWRDIEFERGLFHVTEKTDAGFSIKDKEERLIPIPTDLLADLKVQAGKRSHQRWIFPAKCGDPDGHMLRQLKKIAFLAGLNCGECTIKNGVCCKDAACCKEFGLHKFRKTFATLHHESGVSIRTLMGWLGHSDLETTIKYLAAADPGSEKTRLLVDKTWETLA